MGRILIAVICLAPLMTGCFSARLAHWASVELTPGNPLGVVHAEGSYDLIAYEFESSESEDVSFRVFRIPSDWAQLPRKSWTTPDGRVLIGLREELICTPVEQVEGPMQEIPYLDFRLALDCAAPTGLVGVILPPEQRTFQYGLVRFRQGMEGGTQQVHEVYGYDVGEFRWVRLGSLNVGKESDNVKAQRIASILFIPALAIDAVGVASVIVLFFVASAEGHTNGWSLGSSEKGGKSRWAPDPVDFSIRGTLVAE